MGLEVSTTHRGKPDPSDAPWWVVPSSWLFWPSYEASGVSFVPKKYQKVSAHLENFHFCTKNNTTVVLLKTASVRVSSMQIMQVRVQNKRKSVRKSRYDGDVSMPIASRVSA